MHDSLVCDVVFEWCNVVVCDVVFEWCNVVVCDVGRLFRFILHAKKTAFVVEHDFIMATYLADRVIVFEGVPSQKTTANT